MKIKNLMMTFAFMAQYISSKASVNSCTPPKGSYLDSCTVSGSAYVSSDANLNLIPMCKFILSCRKLTKNHDETIVYLMQSLRGCLQYLENCDGILYVRENNERKCITENAITTVNQEKVGRLNGVIGQKIAPLKVEKIPESNKEKISQSDRKKIDKNEQSFGIMVVISTVIILCIVLFQILVAANKKPISNPKNKTSNSYLNFFSITSANARKNQASRPSKFSCTIS